MEKVETGGGEADKEPATIEKLQEQLENLNKGIASYRDKATASSEDAKAAREEARQAKEEASKIREAIDKAGKEEDDKNAPKTELSKSDQEKLEAWAKSQGFVSKNDMEAERTRLFSENLKNVEAQAVEEFTKAHPELNNDQDWPKIKEQFALYKQPTSLTGYRQVLGRIHKDLYGAETTDAKARAELRTRERLALGGGSQKDEEVKGAIDDLQEKYPHLSRETIVEKLAEINSLATARNKRIAARKR